MTSPESDSLKKVGRVLTPDEVHFVSLADNFTVQLSNLLKLPLEWKTKQNSFEKRVPDLGRMRNFHTAVIENETRNMHSPCSLYQSLDHGVWFCKQFHDKGVEVCWQFATERKLCFRFLATDHRGKDCRKACRCGIIECCPLNHHRLLHGLKKLSEARPMNTLPHVEEERHPVIPWEGVPIVTMTSCNDETSNESYLLFVTNCPCVDEG